MNNNQISPDAISHKDLNILLSNAKKEKFSAKISNSHEDNEDHEFNELIADWTSNSQRILLELNKKNQDSTKNINPKSLLALGALGAHITMALQALKATEFD